MAEIKQLQPHEYSEDRKKAMAEAEAMRKEKEDWDKKKAEDKGETYTPPVSGSLKNKIQCTKCGELKPCKKSRMESMIQRMGSEEAVRSSYLCRGCKKK